MAVDTNQILAEADKLGQLVAQHPAVEKYKAAQKAVADDTDANRTMAEFERQLETLARQEATGMPITDAQRGQLEAIQSRIVSNIKVKNLNMAQVEFVDLLRKVNQAVQGKVVDTGGTGAGGIRARCLPFTRSRDGSVNRDHDGVLAFENRTRRVFLQRPATRREDDLGRRHQRAGAEHLRTMKKGDLAPVYHTGSERAIVGVADIASAPYADPARTTKSSSLSISSRKSDSCGQSRLT